MKTTNLLLDHILVGAIWLGSALIPWLLADPDWLPRILKSAALEKAALLPAVTVLVYICGVAFDQFANRILDYLARPLGLQAIGSARRAFPDDSGASYHEALQAVVARSQRAYDYLSYRRSVIRIIRSLFVVALLLAPTLTVSALVNLTGWANSPRPLVNFLGLGLVILAGAFLRQEIIRLHLGYFSALKNFYLYTSPAQEDTV